MPAPNSLVKVLMVDPAANRWADQLLAVLNPLLRNVGGDLRGPLSSPMVSGWMGLPLSALMATPAVGQVPKWNGVEWEPGSAGSAGTITAVTATAPLASSGGTTPNITIAGSPAGAVAYANGTTLSYSAAGTIGQVLLSGGVGAPTWSTQYFNPAPGSAGRILYDDGSAWVALAAGSSGQFLKTNGAGLAPAWAAVTTGTVTSIIAGTGLTGGTITTSGTIAADFGTIAGKIAQGNDSRFNPSPSTFGRIAYDNGSGWVALAPGTAGQFLTTNGVGFAPTWSASSTGTVTSVGFDLTSSSYATVTNPTSNVVIGLNIGSSPGRLADGADNRFNVTPGSAGRIAYDTGLAWAALAAGTSGQLLSSNGASAPSWLTPSASTTGAGIGAYRATTSTPDSIALADYVVDVNTTGLFTVNLPTAGSSAGQAPSGRVFVVKNSGGATVSVVPAGVQTIDGAASFTIVTRYASFTFISTGSGWALL